MKKFSLAVAIVVMGLAMASCGNKEKELMQKATDFYTQAETELKGIDNFEGFVTYFQGFKQKFNDFKATYSNMKLSQETQQFLSDKANAFNSLETQKAGELITPYLEQMEKTSNICNFWNSMGDKKMEEVLKEKWFGITPETSEEETKKAVLATIGVAPSASDEEFAKAVENWTNTKFGFALNPNASDEEMNKAFENLAHTMGVDINASDEEQKKAVENYMSLSKETLDGFVKSYEEIKEILPEDLKGRCEQLKNSINESL